jgi:ribosomal protein S18 acetylase RimI-like enzyme
MTAIYRIQTRAELNRRLDEMTRALSRAFYHNPFYIHMMPDDRKRMSQIRWWMEYMLRYTLRNGILSVTSDHKGIAMWLGPKNPELNTFQFVFSGMILFPFKVGLRGFIRMVSLSARFRKQHARQDKPHYYLMIIGIDPSLQGKGVGSQLVREVTAKADFERLDCYLETLLESNVLFYTKLGFEVIYNENFAGDKQYWIMRRIPC